MITLKTPKEIQLLRKGGKILHDILHKVAQTAKPGMTTADLSDMAEREILLAGGEPSFKGYGGEYNPFPAALCVAVNSELVHGIPKNEPLQDGDIIGLDIGMRYPKGNGLYTDMAITVAIGEILPETKKLMEVTKGALNIWLKRIKPGRKLNEIAKEVQEFVEKNGFSVVRDLVGHGVGHGVHEEPQIPNYYTDATTTLKEGMVIALEPMVAAGHYEIETLEDGWTVIMKDRSISAHYEHTVAVTKDGNIVITGK